jgi:hypothetical protein
MVRGVVCEAIQAHLLLEFQYGGRRRVVAPYCHGVSRAGSEVLRALQVRGSSRSGGFGFGKLWTMASMTGVRMTDEPFTPDDPDYNPADSAMRSIHCCI